MSRRTCAGIVLCGLLVSATGCSWESGASSGANIGMNLSRHETYLRVWLDYQPGKQNMAKKAAMGYSEWKIKEQVSTSPKLKFQITKPDKVGRVTMVSVSFYQEFKADYSHQPDFTFFTKDNSSEAQMKPDVEYDMGKPVAPFTVIDLEGKTTDGVKLDPGKKYKLVLTVKADKSETASVEFKTN